MKNIVAVEPYAINKIENRIIFSDKFTRGFFSYDCIEGKVNSIGSAKHDNCNGMDTCLYYRCVTTDGHAVFIPHHSDAVVLLDTQKGDIDEVVLPEKYRGILGKFSCGLAIKEKILMFGFNIQGIVAFNTLTKDISELKVFGDELPISESTEGNRVYDAVSYGEMVYFVSLYSNALYRLHLTSNTIKSFPIQSTSKGFVSIQKHNEKLYLIPKEGNIIIEYNTKTDSYCTRSLSESESDRSFVYGKIYNSKLILFPRNHSDIILVDLDGNEGTVKYTIRIPALIGEGVFIDENYYASVVNRKAMIKINMNTGEYSLFDLNNGNIDPNLYKKLFLTENECFGIREFIFGVSE